MPKCIGRHSIDGIPCNADGVNNKTEIQYNSSCQWQCNEKGKILNDVLIDAA